MKLIKNAVFLCVMLLSAHVSAQFGVQNTSPVHDIQIRNSIGLSSVTSDRWCQLVMNPKYNNARQYAIRVDGNLKEVYHYSYDTTADGSLGTSNANLFMRLSLLAPTNSFRMNELGDIGIGISPDSRYQLYVAGDLRANGTVYSNSTALTSDARLKTEVQTITTGRDLISSLRPVHYFKHDEVNSEDGHAEFGFIAQEVREVLPELVKGTESDSTYLSLDYNSFIAILTAANQEQIKANRELTLRVEELENAINVKSSNNQASLTNILTFLIGASVVFTLILTRRKKVTAGE